MSSEHEWWRGTGEDQRVALREAIANHEAKDDGRLFDLMFIGRTAYRAMQGVGENKDVAKLVAQMIADCEIEIRASSMLLMAETDPGSEAARKAHFNARVAARMVGLLNDYVSRGYEAQDSINHPTE